MSPMEQSSRFPLAHVVVDADPSFTLGELCRACDGEREALIALVEEGFLDPAGADPESWRFPAPALRTARVATRLARDLELDLAGVAIVLDLLARIDELEARLRRSGQH
jgi:chaperone modulatory protein CbpM